MLIATQYCIVVAAARFAKALGDATLVLVGAGNSAVLQKQIEKLGLGSYILLTGFLSEETLCKICAVSDVYFAPSRWEEFERTLLDAMSAGKLVIATNAGAIPEVVQDGINRVLVEFGDVESTVHYLRIFLTDDALAQRISASNVVDAREKISWSRCARATVETYRELAGKERDRA